MAALDQGGFGGAEPARGPVFRLIGRTLAVGIVLVLAVSAVFAGVGRDVDPAGDATFEVSLDPATVAALRAFEARVRRIHARQLARVGALDGAGEPTAAGALALPDTPRLRLRGVLDRMAISTGWQVEQDSWRAGIRLRYARSVEFDPATRSYALIEAAEIIPSASFRIVTLGRATRVVVRRTGHATWEQALFAAPSRWLFVDRPDRTLEVERLAPGTTVTLSNEATLFVGADLSTDLGSLPLGVRVGPFASGEYFVRLERLPASAGPAGDREWIVSVGGVVPRGFESSLRLRTPDLVRRKRLRLVEAHWRSPRGVRFLLRAGPLDFRGNPDTAEFLRAAMKGVAAFRFADVRLLAANLGTVGPRAELGPKLLARLERFPNFRRLLAAARADPDGIPYSESISRFAPRKWGETGIGLWALFYGFDLTSSWYAEESLAVPSGGSSATIYSYPLERRWDRGWLFFPRETQDLQMVTVEDAGSEEMFTELSLEIEDARARRREGRAYRGQILGFLTREVTNAFARPSGTGSPGGPRSAPGELPDLAGTPAEEERVSIYLRIILGSRFHDRLLLGTKDASERRKRISEWQKRMSSAIRRGGDAVEELVRTHGVEDLFVSYRIALTPYARRKETPRPTTIFTGSLGDPQRISSYRRLRDAFDAAGTIY